jgi:hypothetical protein
MPPGGWPICWLGKGREEEAEQLRRSGLNPDGADRRSVKAVSLQINLLWLTGTGTHSGADPAIAGPAAGNPGKFSQQVLPEGPVTHLG